ncbi:bifunctional methionine sulfoxide reductase B/A protein [Candidatus Dojkabacteria bacterium]|nr:bifunctional methionine sulfoxide reductase B/A protein [Candidatus Dojkabacteria bacterium]
MNKLTELERKVILEKSTERAFTGEYDDFFKDGIYVCKQCDNPLFDSKAKFEAGCGWPAFDDTFPDSVRELVDSDGYRTEIVCNRCGGHLGHVFKGENMTEKDTRHCVNSISIRFIPVERAGEYIKAKTVEKREIVLGGGCFWCIEAVYKRVPGILETISGYAGGTVANPTYEQVTTGRTGHAEVAKLIFDPSIITLEKILEVFYLAHDPTTLNRQGNDVGTQYRSIILYSEDMDLIAIQKVIKKVSKEFTAPIVTEVRKLDTFYEAEDYHKNYYENNSNGSYCRVVIKPKLDKVLHELRKN